MKKAALFHGTGGSPDLFWFPWLKQSLEGLGYSVWAPQLPDADDPHLDNWLAFVQTYFTCTSETVLVGHSAGCPLILSLLERSAVRIAKAVLVSGFVLPLKPDAREAILQESYDWERIKQNANEIVIINSDNDPWGCDQRQAQYMFDHLGGTMIMRHGEGHMGSLSFDQPYREFPLLRQLIGG